MKKVYWLVLLLTLGLSLSFVGFTNMGCDDDDDDDTPAATTNFFVDNQYYLPLYYIYVEPSPNGSNGQWTHDYLGDNVLPSNSGMTLIGNFPNKNYDLAVIAQDGAATARYNENFNGADFQWTITSRRLLCEEAEKALQSRQTETSQWFIAVSNLSGAEVLFGVTDLNGKPMPFVKPVAIQSGYQFLLKIDTSVKVFFQSGDKVVATYTIGTGSSHTFTYYSPELIEQNSPQFQMAEGLLKCSSIFTNPKK